MLKQQEACTKKYVMHRKASIPVALYGQIVNPHKPGLPGYKELSCIDCQGGMLCNIFAIPKLRCIRQQEHCSIVPGQTRLKMPSADTKQAPAINHLCQRIECLQREVTDFCPARNEMPGSVQVSPAMAVHADARERVFIPPVHVRTALHHKRRVPRVASHAATHQPADVNHHRRSISASVFHSRCNQQAPAGVITYDTHDGVSPI